MLFGILKTRYVLTLYMKILWHIYCTREVTKSGCLKPKGSGYAKTHGVSSVTGGMIGYATMHVSFPPSSVGNRLGTELESIYRDIGH